MKNSSPELEKIKSDLLSLVSHELRTPLNSVLNSLLYLSDQDLVKPQGLLFLESALRSAQKLNSSLSELLDLATLDSGSLPLHFQELSLTAFLKEAISQQRKWAEKNNRTFKVAVFPNVRALVFADALRLNQVFFSLLENAFKFSSSDSPVFIRFQKEKKGYSVLITNHLSRTSAKEMLNSKDLRKLQCAFSQKEPLLTRKKEGLGGSLALSSSILEQHGGDLRLSVQEGGKKFVAQVWIPSLSGKQALLKILENRMVQVTTGVGAIVLTLFEVTKMTDAQRKKLLLLFRASMLRSSDLVLAVNDKDGEFIALIMNDYRKKHVPQLLKRMLKNADAETSKLLRTTPFGFSSCPEDTVDPHDLFQKAKKTRKKN